MTKRKIVVDPNTGEVLDAIVADDDFSLPGVLLIDDISGAADIGDTVTVQKGRLSVRKPARSPEELVEYRQELAARMTAVLREAQGEKTSSQ